MRQTLSTRQPPRFHQRFFLVPIALAWIILALGISSRFYRVSRKTAGVFALPLDDAYIYLRYGERLFTSGPYKYSKNDPISSGSTSLVYPWIPGFLHLLGVPSHLLPEYVFWISALFLGLLAFLAFLLVQTLVEPEADPHPHPLFRIPLPGWMDRVSGRLRMIRGLLPERIPWVGYLAGMVAGLSVLSSPFLLWGILIGMEGGIYSCVLLSILLLWVYSLRPTKTDSEPFSSVVPGQGPFQRALLLLLVGICPLCRPEGFIVSLSISLLALFRAPTGKRLKACLVWGLVLLPFMGSLVVHRILIGEFAPNTAVAKSVLHEPSSDVYRMISMIWNNAKELFRRMIGESRAARPIFNWTALTVGLALLGLARGLWMLLGRLLDSFFSFIRKKMEKQASKNAPTKRHEGSVLPMGLGLLAWAGICAAVGLLVNRVFYFDNNRYALGLILTTLLLAVVTFGQICARFGMSWVLLVAAVVVFRSGEKPIRNIEEEYGKGARDTALFQIETARYIRKHLPKNARIGVNDAGAIPFYSRRPVMDIVGLVTNGFARPFRNGNGSLYEALENLPKKRRPGYFAIFPRYLTGTGLLGRLLFRPRRRRTAGAGSNVNVLYEARWEVAGSGHALPHQIGKGGSSRKVVDRVDVADIKSELDHSYTLPRPDLKWHAWRMHYSVVRHEALTVTGPLPKGSVVTDGGRPVVRSERMRIRTCGHDRCVWASRVSAFRSCRLSILLNGRKIGAVQLPPQNRFAVVSLDLPGTKGERSLLEIRVEKPDLRRPSYAAYQHWIAAIAP